ncbi:Alpha-D-phosphohexomutase, C-terminal [Kalmanozyma brasiliensis GHG001]|uniref:Alpha-D-phosphohexomutase, C-terminal n=1 Tax=Kalmanozyma brasiliensis (strain GHG001) TaxID=1365824 RepID=UPI002868214E|nr:Alpha-D-phosphohexomutase, C-terminal [Kalmanozyma brasiliensis GHG001]KAF6767238.1 Alpha-D-phosphohexomutase, C-terminal [Kalmanozyma brasiliensis GHG001]
MSSELLTQAKAWLEKDPDPTTKDQLAKLIDSNNIKELQSSFRGRLEFGTAGLRGVMGVGPSKMNLLTVLETTAGLAEHLLKSDKDKATTKGVAIAFDGRFGSREFAYSSAQHFAYRGIPSHIYPTPTPTPMCGYAVKKLGLAGGIVVTASHNPKEYNGYKVYGPAGTQINTPVDGQIADEILKVAQETQPPTLADLEQCKRNGTIKEFDDEMLTSYIKDVQALHTFTATPVHGKDAPISIAYSPLHGVGAHSIDRLSKEVIGLTEGVNFWISPEQRVPDGAFPTLEFPNPEELSTLERVHALSEQHHTGLAIVNDPDADRLAVSARDQTGKLRALTGDQLGALLGDEILRRASKSNAGKAGVWTLSTIVSSRLLARLSGHWGGTHVETLTGFKWLGNVARSIESRKGTGSFGFGYEEALGYMAASSVWDKDGLSSYLLVVSMAFDLAREGKTLWDRLEELHRLVGVSVTMQKIIQLSPDMRGTDVMTRLRADLDSGKDKVVSKEGKSYPFSLVDDLSTRPKYDEAKAEAGDLSIPRNDVLRFYVAPSHIDTTSAGKRDEQEIMLGDIRIIVRPSGTEPKVKIYTEALGQIREGERYDDAVKRVTRELEEVVEAFWGWMS